MEERKYMCKPLSNKVLAVAIYSDDLREWRAFIGKGKNNDKDYRKIAGNGKELNYETAKKMFPDLASNYYWGLK